MRDGYNRMQDMDTASFEDSENDRKSLLYASRIELIGMRVCTKECLA
jgi:hypothetical protein